MYVGCVCIYLFIQNEKDVILCSFWRTEKIDIYLATVTRWLSGMSGLGRNPSNRQMVLSSGGVGAPRYFFSSIFFSKNKKKYDLTRPKVPEYSRVYDGLREPPRRVIETSLPRGGSPRRATRSSSRAVPPEHLHRQYPLRGPIPET